jgi:hypothetical protein
MTKINLDENRDYSKEIWHRIIIEELKGDYSVSDMGRVRNNKTEKILKPWITNKGYLAIYLPAKKCTGKKVCRFTIHWLVLAMFTDDPDKAFDRRWIVNHKDGIKHHSYLSNLEWVTYKGNYEHAIENDLCKNYGDGVKTSKHSADEIRRIAEMLVNNKSYKEIREALGYPNDDKTEKFLTAIATRSKWRHITKHYNFTTHDKNNIRKYSEETVMKICECIENGFRNCEIIEELEITDKKEVKKYLSLIHRIKKKTAFKEISQLYNI